MTSEAQRLITVIQQMETSLGDERANGQYELSRDDLRVTYPLNRCIAFLREKSEGMAKLHRERFEQVKSESNTPPYQTMYRFADYEQNWSMPSSPTLLTWKPRSFK